MKQSKFLRQIHSVDDTATIPALDLVEILNSNEELRYSNTAVRTENAQYKKTLNNLVIHNRELKAEVKELTRVANQATTNVSTLNKSIEIQRVVQDKTSELETKLIAANIIIKQLKNKLKNYGIDTALTGGKNTFVKIKGSKIDITH